MTKSIERCSPCAQAALITLVNKIVRKISPAEAKNLYKQVMNERISIKKYLVEVRKILRKDGTIKDLRAVALIEREALEEG
jgi:2-hydroxy-3-keto-5-methylthiopentenyl-1-phosphate phosphatase